MKNVSSLVKRLDAFIAPLSSSVSDACRNSSKHYISALKEDVPWAYDMHDSSAKPQSGLMSGNVNSLGTFEECLELKSMRNVSAQFCTAMFSLRNTTANTPVEEMIASKGVIWGYCLPTVCSTSEVKTSLGEWMKDWDADLTRVDCQDSYLSMDGLDWFAIFVLTALVLCVLVCTGYDVYLSRTQPEYDRKRKDDYRTSFSLLNNFHFLMQKASDSDVRCLYGIRVLSIGWILFGHVVFVVAGVPAVNYLKVSKMTSSWTAMPIISATLAVDTFLMISGLLVANKYLKMVPRGTPLKQVSLSTIPVIANRYLRIAPPVAILILLQVSLWRHAGAGPLWVSGNSYLVEFCQENWFWALLFLQNYVAGNRMCFGHSWYLNVDMQLFLLSPLIITPLLYWRERICLLLFGCLIFGGFLISFIINYVWEFPPGLMAGDETKWAAKNQYYYVVTHTRFAPYIIGIAIGYLLHKHRDTQIVFPVFKENRPIVFWTLAAAALLYSIFGVLPFQAKDYVYSAFPASLFIAAVPIIWTLGVGWFVLASELKQWPFLRRFLGSSRFHALARLTYCVYLVHLPIMNMRATAGRIPVYLTPAEMAVDYFGDCVMSVLFAVFLYVGVEGPFTKFGYIVSNWLIQKYDGPTAFTSREGETSRTALAQASTQLPKRVAVPGSSTESTAAGPSTSLAEVVVHKEGEEPAAEESQAEKLLPEKPAAEEAQAEKPAAEEAQAEKPAAEEPQAEKPATEGSAADKPTKESPTEAPPAEETRAEKATAEKPTTDESPAEKTPEDQKAK